MMYFVLKIITTAEKTTKAVYDFATLKEAEQSVHSEFSKCLNTAGALNSVVMLINSDGGVHETFTWAEDLVD